MIIKRGQLERHTLGMIRQHAPIVAAGAGLVVRKTGKTYEISLPAVTRAKLDALIDPGVTPASGATANMGPPPPVRVPPIPRLGP